MVAGCRAGLFAAGLQTDRKTTVTVFDAADATRILKSNGDPVSAEGDVVTKWTSPRPWVRVTLTAACPGRTTR